MSERDAVEMLLDWFPAGHPAIDELIGVRAACARLKKWNDEAANEIERLRALLKSASYHVESEGDVSLLADISRALERRKE